MNIVVLLKQVPDTGLPLRTRPLRTEPLGTEPVKTGESSPVLDEASVKWTVNPYDEFALAEALRLKPLLKGRVFAFSLGPERAQEVLRGALSLGADEAFHLLCPELLFDPLQTASLLAEKIKPLSFSLILCGKASADADHFAVPQMLARLLDLPFAVNVGKSVFENGCFTLTREIGGGRKEILEGKAPLLISADKGLSEPRLPSLAGVMKAKTKPLHVFPIKDSEGFVRLSSLRPPPPRPPPIMISGSPDEQVRRLTVFLRDKEKLF